MPKGRRPESVLVVVYTRKLECLLLERRSPPGFWQSVTGGLDWNESPQEAAARELFEETGLDGANLRDGGFHNRFPILPAWRQRYAAEVDENLEHVWYLQLEEFEPIKLSPEEHVRYVWLPRAEAVVAASSWTNKDALRRIPNAD